MSFMRRLTPWGAITVTLAVLSGCGDDPDDLHQWLERQKADATLSVKPVKPPSVFQPEMFVGAQGTSPFSDEKLVRALRTDVAGAAVSRALLSEQQRPREELEAYPLDAFTMVGMLEKGGRRVALVKVGGVLHQVRVGQYMGQNYGRVVSISETQIVLREIVQDASGEWVERTETLQLMEGGGQ